MGSKFLFILLAICIIATGVMASVLREPDRWWIYASCAVAMLLLVLLFRSVIMPSNMAMRGMELISAQDFNNRLAKVGEHNADKIVILFNSLIDRLRNERLRNIEQDCFLRLLIDASPMGVMMLDFDGKVSMVNKSMLRITGLPEDADVTGKAPVDLSSELAGKMSEVPLGDNRILRLGDIRMYRCYHLSFIQTGFPRRFYLLESLTEEVMKAEREAYEKVIRIISHEVNNTMGGVKSVLEFLHDSTDDEDVREVIESCDDRCDGMCSFIRAYADVVRVPEPLRKEVDLNRELSAMMPFLREMAGSDIMMRFIPCESLPLVRVDMALIQQVIVNVVKNAVESISGAVSEYEPSDVSGIMDNSVNARCFECNSAGKAGFVDIATGDDRGCAWLEISNNGSTISEEISRKLFSPFFTTKKKGRGLGLTLICEILKRHNAQFSLRTTSDGITRFHISFR